MGLFDSIRAAFGAKKPAQIRRFNAAQMSRLTSGWQTVSPSANSDIRMDIEALRARSRDLANNNDYARKFLQMVETNVVGPDGFVLRSMAAKPDGSPDQTDRNSIEAAFDVWTQAGECDVTGRYGFADLQRMVIRAVARDGECLIRRVRDKRGYRQQLIDIDRLDTKYNEPNIVMGIEIDDTCRPVAYHLLTKHPGDNLRGGAGGAVKRERVDASDIFHLFRPDRPEQQRGVPWMHTAMLRLQMLGAYEEAALVAARTGAAKMGFFTAEDDGSALADGESDSGEFLTDADPGTFGILPKGYTFQSFDPDYPTANYDTFVKSCLRGIASGLGVAYNTLANDLEGVNFSSIRSGTLEERDNWMVIQKWMVSAYLIPTFIDWLEAGLLAGTILGPTGMPLPSSKLFKFRAHTWQGRRWSWVDPLKDIEASLTAIRAGLNSPQQVAAQMGLDLDDIMEALATANARADALGLPKYCEQIAAPAPIPADQAPAVVAAKAHADAMVRSAEVNRDAAIQAAKAAPSPVVNVAAPVINLPEMRHETTVAAPVINLPEMRADVHVNPTPINVAAPNVKVDVAAPEVQVEVEATLPPPEIRVELPARKTDTLIERDANGNISRATQVETTIED